MPIYESYCKTCGDTVTEFRKLADYARHPQCCDGAMTAKLNAPFVHEDIKPYRSQVTGEMISSRVRHRNHLKEHGCTEVGNESLAPRDIAPTKAEKYQLRKDMHDKAKAAKLI